MRGKPSLTALVPDSCCMHGVLLSQDWLRDIFVCLTWVLVGQWKLGFIQTPRGPWVSSFLCGLPSLPPFCFPGSHQVLLPFSALLRLSFCTAGEGKLVLDCVQCLLCQAQGYSRKQGRRVNPLLPWRASPSWPVCSHQAWPPVCSALCSLTPQCSLKNTLLPLCPGLCTRSFLRCLWLTPSLEGFT